MFQNNQKFDDAADDGDFNEVLEEKKYNDYNSPNEVFEDSIDEDGNSLSDDSESGSEILLNEELLKLSVDSFKALKEAVYEIDDKMEENQKTKRETHLESNKRKFQEEDEDDDDEFEEIDENIHKDNKRHDGCHCNINCASKNEESIIGKLTNSFNLKYLKYSKFF